jgi:hypothetical protein
MDRWDDGGSIIGKFPFGVFGPSKDSSQVLIFFIWVPGGPKKTRQLATIKIVNRVGDGIFRRVC